MSTALRRYDVDAAWDDPFERNHERRRAKRHRFLLKATLSVEIPGTRQHLIGPAIVQDISTTGIWALTKHRLTPGMVVSLILPTGPCPSDLFLPESFTGDARVIRVRSLEDSRSLVALQLAETFSQNMEFAMFVDYLGTIARTIS